MSAPRKPQNRGLPANLYHHPRGFRYRRPDGSFAYLGKDKAQAIEAAVQANNFYAAKQSLFQKIVSTEEQTLSAAIGDYLKERLPKFEIAESTRKNREYALRIMQGSDLGTVAVDEITTRQLHLYLESLNSDWTRQGYRAQLLQLFAWTVQTGLREDNPATALARPKAKRARQRLTIEEFTALRAHAPNWLRNLMDLQLHTLQRPGDVVQMRWEDVTATSLRVIQRKTGKRLELRIEGPLRAVLQRCRDELLCPFIIHRKPEKLRGKDARAKTREHHFQVLLEQAERAFVKVRESSGLYAKTDHPPTLHEIRSLGGSLYRESGWPEHRVQMLMGHSDLKMTRHYLAGHEAPWEEVEAGLNLPSICY